jgi:hypothetical protein
MSNAPRVYEKSFNESWSYVNLLKSELGAASYDIQPFPGTFKSGRAKWIATFTNRDNKVIARRIGMELQSKKTGQNYKVFSRDEWVDKENTPPRPTLRREQTNDYSLEDILSEVTA